MLSLINPLVFHDLTSLPVLITSALLGAAIGSAIIAFHVSQETRPPDLQLLHREVDEARVLIQEARRRGDDGEEHQRRLRALQTRLPKDDLRRKL